MTTTRASHLIFILLAATLFMTAGCEEEDPEEQQQLTAEEILEGKWRLVAYTRLDSAGNFTDLYGLPTDCANDDTVIFQAGGVFISGCGIARCVRDRAGEFPAPLFPGSVFLTLAGKVAFPFQTAHILCRAFVGVSSFAELPDKWNGWDGALFPLGKVNKLIIEWVGNKKPSPVSRRGFLFS